MHTIVKMLFLVPKLASVFRTVETNDIVVLVGAPQGFRVDCKCSDIHSQNGNVHCVINETRKDFAIFAIKGFFVIENEAQVTNNGPRCFRHFLFVAICTEKSEDRIT